MKEGYRLRAKDKRSWGGMILIPIAFKPFPDWGQRCLVCNAMHRFKTYHLNIDSLDGTCIVSPKIFENLKKVGAIENYPGAGPELQVSDKPAFTYEGLSNDPPTLGLGMGRGGKLQPIRKRKVIHIDYGDK